MNVEQICTPCSKLSLADINARNRQFALEQSKLLEKRISNEVLLELAMHELRSEWLRGVPVRWQTSLEQALADAEKAQVAFQTSFSKRGGKTRKTDALQQRIEITVRNEPAITEGELLRQLHKLAAKDYAVIQSVDRASDVLAGDAPQIHYYEGEQIKTAPISGLKHRLSRAKRKINTSR